MSSTHHKYHRNRLLRISKWYFLIIFLIFAVIAIVALRNNNQQMIILRNQVFLADEQNGNVEAALKNLREYVAAHMNTNLSSGPNAIKPPIQLKYRYQRLSHQAEKDADVYNSRIYNDAQHYCERLIPDHTSLERVPCIKQYISSHPLATPAVRLDPALYQFDFVSPYWSPDLAGWSIVIALIFLVLFVTSYCYELWQRRLQKV